MSALQTISNTTPQNLGQSSRRLSLLGMGGTLELLTFDEREREPLFDLAEGGVGLVSHHPLPVGTLVLGELRLPSSTHRFDVIVRVAWAEGHAMGLEFVMPDEDLKRNIRVLRAMLEP
jgi:hypothetical protein